MSLQHLLFVRFREIGWLGRFVLAVSVAAVASFVQIFLEMVEAASHAGTHIVGDFEITVCYFGPPASFYPRLLIASMLLIASIGVFQRSFPRSILAITGLIGALSTYIFWWADSYRLFRNLELPFLNNPYIKQTAYLYQGSWLDVGVAMSVVVSLVLLLDRSRPHCSTASQ